MRLQYSVIPLLIVGLAFVFACGGDDDGDVSDGGGEPTAAADGDMGGQGGGGNATLTIGENTWEFDQITCQLSPGEFTPNLSLSIAGTTEGAGGEQLQLDATVIDDTGEGRIEGDDVIRSVAIRAVDTEGDDAVNWSTIGRLLTDVEQEWTVDGKSVQVEAVFDDRSTDEVVEVPGTLEATCP